MDDEKIVNARITRVELVNFRNYEDFVREFSPGINWITGANGSGKTNLLEAVLCLGVGKSYRAIRQDELVTWDKDAGRVKGEINKDGEVSELEVNIWKAGVGGRKSSGKGYKVNGVGKLLRSYVGMLPVVWFGPEDMDLVSGGSGVRRRFLDTVLSQLDGKYVRAIREYEQALRRRNKLLEILAEGKTTRQAFYYFDDILVSRGGYIHQARQDLVDYLNEYFVNDEKFSNLRLEYDHSVISKKRLVKYQYEEVAAGVTLVGPQRDDLKILSKPESEWIALRNFGSRGQQRMGALALKMGELEFLTNKLAIRPVLLLDDVLSELDAKHKKMVMEVMEQQQTIVTGVEKV